MAPYPPPSQRSQMQSELKGILMNNNYVRENNSRHRYSPYVGPHANTQQVGDNEDEVLSAKSGPGQLGGIPVLSNLS